ncbi:hypothetical protein RFM68_33365 [Mesorhizobium sp. MSK_1335]|uniref:Uncharacterized protein n=1 Tax=Mesorhizobium montanum TaxID=3072323 RepID=A0ABU4ZY19_9HYPH|nr:hypothetical protein [Mesorhizobium sp. MSK_1335]MDX8529317.1 hypothetical protein [Mesorhizobium sp. MSK_1335]
MLVAAGCVGGKHRQCLKIENCPASSIRLGVAVIDSDTIERSLVEFANWGKVLNGVNIDSLTIAPSVEQREKH